MSLYSKIKKYYFTACIIMLAVLTLLEAARHDWNLSIRTMMAVLTGWFVMCAAVIGVIFFIFNRKHRDTNDRTSRS